MTNTDRGARDPDLIDIGPGPVGKSQYEALLQQARKTALESAKQLVPKMYDALLKEDPSLSAKDVRDKIEKDCRRFWSKRTILDALPATAKDPGKQEAGRQSHKTRGKNCAADTAAENTARLSSKPKLLAIVGGHEQLDQTLSEELSRDFGGQSGPSREGSKELELGIVKASELRDDYMTIAITLADEEIESFLKLRPNEDKIARITKLVILVDRRTERPIAVQLAKTPEELGIS